MKIILCMLALSISVGVLALDIPKDRDVKNVVNIVDIILGKLPKNKEVKETPKVNQIYLTHKQLEVIIKEATESGKKEGYKEGYKEGLIDGLKLGERKSINQKAKTKKRKVLTPSMWKPSTW